MKVRPERNIEIFSLSAIDLFAAAMGAFALLAIILLPYYQNEIREDTPDNALSDLLRAAQTSAVETEEQRKALEAARSTARRAVSDIESEADKLRAKLRAAEAELEEKQAAAAAPAVPVPEPIEDKPAPPSPTPKKAKVTFRFLGMKTVEDDVVVALDMNRCMAGHEESIKKALGRIFNSLQENHRLQVVGFQQTDSGPRTQVWPTGGGLRQMTGGAQSQAVQFSNTLTRQFGGSASMIDVFRQLIDGPGEAIFLVSDGLPNPKANDGKGPGQVVREITRMNEARPGGPKEIHTVVVGNYFDYSGTVEFMEDLAGRNNGQFMALASTTVGACD